MIKYSFERKVLVIPSGLGLNSSDIQEIAFSDGFSDGYDKGTEDCKNNNGMD